MPEALLAGVQVVDLGDEPGARAARLLGDLGATVVRVVPPDGDPLDARPAAERAWNAGKTVVRAPPDDPGLSALLAVADVVVDAPRSPGLHHLDPATAPGAAWVSITPFGREGSRAAWRAGDLGAMAASGNLYCTGDPDRAPVRPVEPTAYAHGGPEAAFAALTALAAGRTGVVDVSLAEVVMIADMGTQARFPHSGERGRRRGAAIGRTREIWRCADGWVTFGIRGGAARTRSFAVLTRLVAADGVDATVLQTTDWATFDHAGTDDETLTALEECFGAWFARHTMRELHAWACQHNLLLAPVRTPPDITACEQLAARDFLGPVGDVPLLPRRIVTVRAADDLVAPVQPAGPAVTADRVPPPVVRPPGPVRPTTGPGGAWAGTRILELGSGAAGPIATRYYVEQGATVLRIESRTRPDFLRVYALGPDNPHGLEGSWMYDSLNVGKRNVTLDLKTPRGVALARRLACEWADAVAENFAPKAMIGLGLDYDTLVADRPDLVMVSACLNGQTGPHRDYPGFGGQGAALAGFNAVTGWPDREPVGPYGTITDSLAPRFVATALAAALLYRRRTGRGVHLDVSQVECGIWSLAPWLVEHQLDGTFRTRAGNRAPDAVPHGVFPCADEGDVGDRWVAVAVWSDAEWATLAEITGVVDPALASLAARQARVEAVEATVAAWTRTRSRAEVVDRLQSAGLEAVPVQDFGDLHDDPQLAHRGHWVPGEHPATGPRAYERNGYRLPDDAGGYTRPHGPLLGEDTEWALGEALDLTAAEIADLAAAGVLR